MVAGQALGCIGSIGSTFNMMLPHYKKIFTLFDAGKRQEALAPVSYTHLDVYKRQVVEGGTRQLSDFKQEG